MPQTRSSRKRDLGNPATGVEVKMGRIRRNPKLPSVGNSETSKPSQQSNDSVAATTHPTTSDLKDVLVDQVESLSKRVDERSAYVQLQQRAITEARERKESNQARIVEIVKDAVDMIKQKETKLMTELDEMTEKQLQQLNDELLKEEADLCRFQQQSDFINKAIQDGNGTKYQTFLEDLTDIGDGASQGDVVRTINTITFNHDSEKVGKAVENLRLAEVDFTYHDNPLYVPVLVNTITYPSLNENGWPMEATDVTVLDIDGSQVVVITDGRNRQLISFYTGHNGPCYSVLPLDQCPNGMARITENRVIIALPKIDQLVTVEVAPELTLLSKITCKSYYSLAVLSPSSLLAGGGHYGTGYCVDIIDMEGNILRSIDSPLFHISAYLFVNNSGNIVVSDGSTHSMFCMTPDGDVVWKHDPSRSTPSVGYTGGIVQTNTGDILVSGENGGNKVMLLTGTGEFVRDVLTADNGLQTPSRLCLDKRGHLFVCDRNDIKEFTFAVQKQ
ncbi:uncharacterized protein LOC124279563 [Haliotis rubra]|uniref:uncharacterized protein LOC124279563 n=1 Tax=Haliotis rubra TaxID=36100 RepID=UPI001EE62C94|nr:uncharacterized protein LOC124279563 [Haliotis rubra]XP_046571348.1 uncharacterized protein LOC124279563 [Haliotis rubra]